jgi:hypothetical protein
MALNPVERRLALLCADWLEFRADVAGRLLVWQVPDNAVRLVQCFVQAQKHDLEYSSRDLFVPFDAPFEHSLQYARALKEQLAGEVEASRAEWAAQGLGAGWALDPAASPDTAAVFIEALRSLGSSLHRSIGHLVAVLMPPAVARPAHWAGWLQRALQARLPERLRLVVVDSLDQPRLEELAAAGDARISVRRPPVNGLAVAQETFAQEVTTGPAGVYRQMLMSVVALMEKGSAEQVKARAADALKFARQQGWSDQEVVLRILVAGAFLKESRHAEAVQTYRAARQAAAQAVQANHPAGRKLMLQGWFGEAGAQLAAGDDAAAAKCYDAAARTALEDQNPLMALEGWRMAAFCHARNGDAAAAQERGELALGLGAQLKPPARVMSTLPLAALELLRVVSPAPTGRVEQLRLQLQARLERLRQEAEQRAAEAETGTHDTAALQRRIEHDEEELQRNAEQELQASLEGTPAQWRGHFDYARALLGADWPLRTAWGPVS